MRWFCSKFRLECSKQQWITLLLLAVFLAALLPFPLSIGRSVLSKDLSEPFPCQDRPCACRTAAQCKKQCCCFTAEQKQAWGQRHGVKAFAQPDNPPKPPAKLLADRQGCCELAHSDSDATSTSTNAPAVEVTTAEASPGAADPRPSAGRPVNRSSRFKLVIGHFAQQCQGVSHTLAGLPIFIVPHPVELVAGVPRSIERFAFESALFESASLAPPVPPPRLA